jgi:hypothetical protein
MGRGRQHVSTPLPEIVLQERHGVTLLLHVTIRQFDHMGRIGEKAIIVGVPRVHDSVPGVVISRDGGVIFRTIRNVLCLHPQAYGSDGTARGPERRTFVDSAAGFGFRKQLKPLSSPAPK